MSARAPYLLLVHAADGSVKQGRGRLVTRSGADEAARAAIARGAVLAQVMRRDGEIVSVWDAAEVERL